MQLVSKDGKIRINNFVCPNCGKGRLLEKKGTLDIFYGCDLYPNCIQTFSNYELEIVNGSF